MKIFYSSLLFVLLFVFFHPLDAQEVFWFEDFDNGATARWNVSGNDPTPAGIPGLVYGVNAPGLFDYFTINDANTPELDGPLILGLPISSQGQFVRGHHYDCSSPSDLPNPFVNSGVLNNSLHITAQAGCAGIIYIGTPGYDDWNCITLSGTDFPLTQTEQYASYNMNIDASSKCNIKLTADFFLGGSADGMEAHSTVLYSVDGGLSWGIVRDNLSTCLHTFAGTCNDWHRRTFQLPPAADYQPDLRIAFRWTEDGNTNNNTQDYALGGSFNVDNVMLSACSKPNIDFISQAGSNVCKMQTVIFTSAVSVNNGAYLDCFSTLQDDCSVSSYSWNISPGTFSYVDGTSGSDESPHVQFLVDGNYTVEVTASTCGGDSILTKVDLISVADCPPTANFISNNTLACADPSDKQDTIVFTDVSSTFAAPITDWLWTFTPGTVTFVNGTNATDPNPEVVFDGVGSYDVSLQVTTSEGIDTEIKTTLVEAISCDCGGGVGGPTNIYFEDFTTGSPGFSLNSVVPSLGTSAGNENSWIVNSIYAGAIFPATPDRGGGNYLHIFSDFGCSFFGDCQAAFNAGGTNLKSFAETPIISTTGNTGVSISFWMLNASTGANGAGYLYYSIDGGANWILEATYNSIAAWTYQSITNPAFDNQASLMFGFLFDEGPGTGGVIDPSFSIDEISVDATGGASLPNTWEGITSIDWFTATNWSNGTVPTALDNVLVPNSVNLVGTFMPEINGGAVALNVCNYGTITIVSDQTLIIDADLLNEGEITTTTITPSPDVIFANQASKYRGAGSLFDVDVAVVSSDFELENDMTSRSFSISTVGTVNLANHSLSISKNLSKVNGTLLASNANLFFIEPGCGVCVDPTSNADVSMDVDQLLGNVYVIKNNGVKTSLISAVNYTISSPSALTIQSGILDANAFSLNGTGDLTMTGGELQLARNSVNLPELSGTFSLMGGRITLDGGDQIIKSLAEAGTNYYELEFGGTGVKTFSSNNVNVKSKLILSQPTGLGNYVNTDLDSLYVMNSDELAIERTGGHIVGYLTREVNPSDNYWYPLGSDNVGGDTYYEPMWIFLKALAGTRRLTGKFFDTPPSPDTVVNVTFITPGGFLDTIREVEEEGYWHVHDYPDISGGAYRITVSPSTYWTMSKPWALGYYSLLKQDVLGEPWDFVTGGVRVNDSTTSAYKDFSNNALTFTDSLIVDQLLPIQTFTLEAEKTPDGHLLEWTVSEEPGISHYEVEWADNEGVFWRLGSVVSEDAFTVLQSYQYQNTHTEFGKNFYRIKAVNTNGEIQYSNVVELTEDIHSEMVRLYPNPARAYVDVELRFSPLRENVLLEIYNANGKLVRKRVFQSNGTSSLTRISLNEFSQGLYWFKFDAGGETQTIKLLIR